MSDDQPPKKKSRFFEKGKSKIGNLLHPLKKSSRKDGNESTEPEANEDGPPLLANVQPLPPTTLPPQSLASFQHLSFSTGPTYGTQSAHGPFLAQQQLRHDLRRQNSGKAQTHISNPTHPQASDSEAETELESDSEGEDDEDEDDASDEENTRPEYDMRRGRKQAIYGAEALLPSSTNINGQALVFPVPPGHGYTFGGVPTNPHVTAAGGQYSFSFQTTQALPTTLTMQQPTYNMYQHPIGSGLARFAQQTAHADTGPLTQRAQSLASHSLPHAPGTPTGPYVDMDRDARGHLLRTTAPRPPAHHGIRPAHTVPAHIRSPDTLVPDNLYTSPQRIERAQHFARISLKRKRPDAILPPPSYVYQHTGSSSFNIFNGLLLYPELCFALAAHLPVKDLLSLYAISKDFHVILDTRFTTVMLSQATRKAPDSARTFMFRTHADLCRNDPAARIPHPRPGLAAQGISRRIPSFRWLKMVIHREKVIHEIMAVFAEDGIPLPARCALALKRLWFMLDIPDNARRIGFSHNRAMLTDLDLYFCACFFVKMDMRLNDPVSGEKRDGMRKLLLAQRSFTTVLRVLKREMWTTRFDVLREWVRLKYEHPPNAPQEEREMSIFGVPASMVGRGKLEYWGLKTEEEAGHTLVSLLRPDQLVVREAFRRGMRFDKHYLRFLLYGYIRPDTLEDYAPRAYGRRIAAIKDDEYEVDDVVGGVAALGVEDEGFDELLDLGPTREVSRFTSVKEETSKGELAIRRGEEEFLDKCIEWWGREVGSGESEVD